MALGRFVRGATVYAGAGLALKVLSLLVAPIYTRFLTVDEFGATNLAESLSAVVAALAGVSLHQGLGRLYFKHEEAAERDRFVSSVLWGATGLCVASLGACLLIGPLILPAMSGWYSVPFFPLVAIALATALVTQLVSVWQRLFQAEEAPRPFAVSRILQGLLTTAAILLFVLPFEGAGVGLLAGRLVGIAGVLVVILVAHGSRMRPSPSADHVRDALRFSAPLIPYQLTALVLEVSDRLVIEATLGTERVGVYALAAMLGGVMIFVNRSVVAAWQPLYYKRVETERGRREIGRDTVRILGVTASVATGGALIAEDFVRIVFDPRYAEAGRLVPWILGGFLLWEISALANLQILERERTSVSSVITVGSGVLNVSLNLWLVPLHGIGAAAVTTLVAYGVQAVVTVAVAQRLRAIPYAWSAGAIALVPFTAALVVTQTDWTTTALGYAARALVLVSTVGPLWWSVRGARTAR